tara:strand:- start:2311 stop:2853 length:543 start_codon:yes stop_codon:yes gene_type:complete
VSELTYHISPGDEVKVSEYVQNLEDLKLATRTIGPEDIDTGSIDYRHMDGTWKLVAQYSDFSTTYASASVAADQLLLPTSASTKTTVGTLSPALVYAKLNFHSTGGNSMIGIGIYLNGSRVERIQAAMEDGAKTTLNIFYMFEAATVGGQELIEFRLDNTVTAANFSISDFEMHVMSARA